MKINFGDRDYESQVIQNTRDIKELKSKVMEWYNTQEDLGEIATYIARTDTDVPDNVSTGFLVDGYAHLYKITGGDDTTLLIEYYSTLGQYTLVDGGGSSAPQIYYHQINYKDMYEDNVMGFITIDCSFIIPSTESTEFNYNNVDSAVKYYLYPAWDNTETALPDKTISASGVISLYDEANDRDIVVPISSIVLQKDGANSVVAIFSGTNSIPMAHTTFTFRDETYNCITDTVLNGLYSFPRPI